MLVQAVEFSQCLQHRQDTIFFLLFVAYSIFPFPVWECRCSAKSSGLPRSENVGRLNRQVFLQAGAKHVYAVEASPMAEYARKLIAGNPAVADRVTVRIFTF